jgi:diguanylate cyclase (GGDEF)-like protein/PAS domain S-box-containing protein
MCPAPDLKQKAENSRRAVDALLREHPDALIFTQTTEGHIVPVPDSLGLSDYPVLAEGGRTGVDLCVAEDRMAVVNAWLELKSQGIAEVQARLRSEPTVWRTVRMFDLRAVHGVVLTIGWVSEQDAPAVAPSTREPVLASTPRFCSRKQDSEGNVIECDEAYVQMFGYEHAEEVVGHPTFDRVHPEDQARLIESWVAVVATARPQMARVRTKRNDGGWLWVDVTYHNYLEENGGGYVLAECIDVSAEMSAQEALRDREELLRLLLDEMPDGLLHLDREREVVYRNQRLLEMLHGAEQLATLEPAEGEASSQVDEPELLSAILRNLPGEALASFDAAFTRSIEQARSETIELEAILSQRDSRTLLFKMRPLTRESGLVTGVIASVQDVTDSAQMRRELERRATYDALTSSHNRASILGALEAELHSGGGVGVLYIDLDRFKQINDTLGHAAGDELLVEVMSRLRSAMRLGDEVGRLGGDEFLVLMRDVSSVDLALAAAQRVSDGLKGTYVLAGTVIELSASVGTAFTATGKIDAEHLIAQADRAMYAAKHRAPLRPSTRPGGLRRARARATQR